MVRFVYGLLAVVGMVALVGCSPSPETKMDKGTTYYTGPIDKSKASMAPGESTKSRAADQ
jgi:hypothetical protein